MRLFCGTSLFTFVCLCVIEQIVEHLKESPLLSCFCSAFPSLQIRPRSLWFQTNNSWPDLLTTWLFLRTDKHSILSHPLLHHLSDTEFYGRKPLVSRTLHTLICLSQWWSLHLSFLCSASWTHQPQWYRTVSKWLYLYKLYICFEIRHCCQYCKLLFFSINTSLYAYIAKAVCAVLMLQFKIWSLCNFDPMKIQWLVLVKTSIYICCTKSLNGINDNIFHLCFYNFIILQILADQLIKMTISCNI